MYVAWIFTLLVTAALAQQGTVGKPADPVSLRVLMVGDTSFNNHFQNVVK